MASLSTRATETAGRWLRRVRWEARRLWRGLGWWGLAMLICAVLTSTALREAHPLSQQVQLLRQRIFLAGRLGYPAPPPAASDGARAAAFYAGLPGVDALPAQLKTLANLARRHGIQLSKGDYKMQPTSGSPLLRQEISLPVKADYAAVQAFMFDALRALPTLSLEAVTFKRDSAASAEVEARIQFVLLFQQEEGPK